MSLGIEEVRHDASALYRFIDSIASSCRQNDDYPSYVEPSRKLFQYIHLLAEATKSHLAKLLVNLDPKLATTDPQDFYSRAQLIRTLRTVWFELHGLVKPALDADTLHVPYSLVHALTNRLQKIHGFSNVQFAVLHSNELNYFQLRASRIRNFALNIKAIVPSAPSFPDDLGIIALPYSQASGIFLNVALAHEMGHFAFQERNESARLGASILGAVQAAAGKPLPSLELVWCKDRVLQWCEELYCDLFALWLIGPSFSFAFIELFAYSRLVPTLSPTGGVTLPPIASQAAFVDSHPAPAFRLGQHVRFLKSTDLDWWQEIKDCSNHFIGLLKDAEALPENIFTFTTSFKPGFESITLSAFFKVLNVVSDAVKATLSGVPTELKSVKDHRAQIAEYLSYGVVPSRLVSDKAIHSPSSVALVNSAHLFYLEQLDTLINKIRGARADCLECRSLWAERVEMWISKALEDVNH